MASPSNEKFIYGFSLSYFRSFGKEEQFFGPFDKVNIIIGRNNSGKSNVLRFIRDAYSDIVFNGNYKVSQRDLPRTIPLEEHHITIKYPTDDAVLDRIITRENNVRIAEAFNGLFEQSFYDVKIAYHAQTITLFPEIQNIIPTNGYLKTLWLATTTRSGGSFDYWVSELTTNFQRRALKKPNIKFIGAYRKYDSRLEEYEEDNGQHRDSTDRSIETLMSFYSPTHDKQKDREKFLKIENFIKEVTGEDKLELHVPHDTQTINIHLHNKVLPIEALGTGIHELLIFAINVISIDEHVVCIEEPELHFHPHMQRQLMRFLSKETTNQYFITTHSSHVMDAVEDATIHTITLEDGFSKAHKPTDLNEKRRICQDLGYFPSDLLQSNSIIWVEGPSDRIYLNYWINKLAPELKEGWHYSIMFYGGALLSHLQVNDSEIDDLINLLSINRFPAIVIDSDLKSSRHQLRDTKKRIIAEFNKVDGIAWVTDGREIENYIPSDIRFNAIKSAHKSAKSLAEDTGKYSKPLNYNYKKDNVDQIKTSGFNKVAIAKNAVSHNPQLDVLDLQDRVEELIEHIQKANT